MDDQGVLAARYTIVPRTAVFLRKGDSYLLLRGDPRKRLWAGRYNGLGGHVDRGETVLTAARREVREESGLEAELWLAGTVIVDSGSIGVGLFVFGGQAIGGALRASAEGTPEWVAIDRLSDLPLVEDVPDILQRVHGMAPGDAPFSARSYFDSDGRLRVEFED